MELSYGSTYSRYDGVADNHYHFVCKKCGKVIDLELNFNISKNDVENALNVDVESHRLEFYGICSYCK